MQITDNTVFYAIRINRSWEDPAVYSRSHAAPVLRLVFQLQIGKLAANRGLDINQLQVSNMVGNKLIYGVLPASQACQRRPRESFQRLLINMPGVKSPTFVCVVQ